MHRFAWIDRWKGCLISLVVLGHAVGGAEHFTSSPYGGSLDDIYLCIYRFHMPAFFVLMGILWHDENLNCNTMLKKIKRLLVPYFTFGLISLLVYAVAYNSFASTIPKTSDRYSGFVSNFEWSSLMDLLLGRGIPENSVLWFLPCMFVVWLIYGCFNAICKRFWWNFVLCGIACVIEGFMSCYSLGKSLPWGFNRFFEFIPFVIIGRYFFRKDELSNQRKGIFLLFVVMGWLAYAMIAPIRIRDWSTLPYGVYYVFSLLRTLLGVTLSLFTIQLLPNRYFAWLSLLGKMSLGIMLTHKWFVLALEMKVTCLRVMFGQELPLALIAVFIVTAISIMASFAMVKIIRIFVPWAIGEKA